MDMLTPRQNILNVLNHQEPAWTPNWITDVAITGFGALPGPAFEKGELGGGYDGFGVRWVAPASGGGAPIPAPGEFLMHFDQIENWRDYIHFPDLDAFDWEGFAAHELAGMDGQGIDRNRVLVDFGSGNGPYERLASFMGFEDACLAIALEPEVTKELIEAIVDWKIEQLPYIVKYLNPDTYTSYDDVCTQKGPFMSPDAYRTLIKPGTKRLFDAVKEAGMMPIQHTCGFAEPFVEDFIDMGAVAWTSVQTCNDIDGLLSKYGDRFTFIGGWDTNGKGAMADATDEEIAAAVCHDLDMFGGRKGFILFAYRLANSLDPMVSLHENMRVNGPAIAHIFEMAGIPLPPMGA